MYVCFYLLFMAAPVLGLRIFGHPISSGHAAHPKSPAKGHGGALSEWH